MRRYLPAYLIVLSFLVPFALVAEQGCLHAPANLSTQGKVAYTADQIVVRVNELENAAISANQQQQLSTNATRTIVQFCVSADETLAHTPDGWLATVQAAWAQTKANLPPISNPAITSALAAVDTVLGVIR